MKKWLSSFVVIALAASWCGAAAPAGELGVGVIAGAPFGGTAKYWLNDQLAVDGGIGYGNAAVFYADLLVNSWTLAGSRDNSVDLYAGLGPRVASDDGGQFAVRLIAGAGYWPPGRPLELFAEVGPTFKITPDNNVGVDGGVGFRYYFNVALTPAR